MKRVLLMSIVASAAALAGNPKMAKDLNTSSAQNVDVIVQFNTPLSTTVHNKVKAHGGALKTELGSIQAAAYTIPANQLPGLSADPTVRYVAPDRPVASL